jgi:hypothetical protein
MESNAPPCREPISFERAGYFSYYRTSIAIMATRVPSMTIEAMTSERPARRALLAENVQRLER